MARLRGHATDPPGRWKEPGAFPAADHATQRAHQRRGRHPIRRRVHRQSGERDGALGSLIPHTGAVGPLVIAMIEPAFRTAPMALARRTHRRVTRRRATRCRAIRVAAITRHADREEAVAAAADFLAKRRVHDVGAAVRFDWTRLANRGTRETIGSVRRSIEAVTEGLEVLRSRPSPRPPQPDSLQLSRDFEGALGGSCSPRVRVIATAAERLHGSSMTAHDQAGLRSRTIEESCRREVEIYAVSGER